jgi:hypothetical protein
MSHKVNLECSICGHKWGAVQADISCQSCDASPRYVSLAGAKPKIQDNKSTSKVYHFGTKEATGELLGALLDEWGYPRLTQMLFDLKHNGKVR